jgi:hypothetical protein
MNPYVFPSLDYTGLPPLDLPTNPRPEQPHPKVYPFNHAQNSGPQALPSQNAFMSQEAFRQNRNVIPGLSFGAAATPSLPLSQAFHRTVSVSGTTTGQPQTIAPNGSSSIQSLSIPSRHSNEVETKTTASHGAVDPQSDSCEEGELTERVFEDLYEPEEFSESLDMRRQPPPHPTTLLKPRGNAPTGAVETRTSGMKDDKEHEEEGM